MTPRGLRRASSVAATIASGRHSFKTFGNTIRELNPFQIIKLGGFVNTFSTSLLEENAAKVMRNASNLFLREFSAVFF